MGWKVEVKDSNAIGSTAGAGRCGMVEFLLEKGADANEVYCVYENLERSLYRDQKAGSPLQRAIPNDKYDMLRRSICDFARCERETALITSTRKWRLRASGEVEVSWRQDVPWT